VVRLGVSADPLKEKEEEESDSSLIFFDFSTFYVLFPLGQCSIGTTDALLRAKNFLVTLCKN
jgi:hypothetical protein